MVNRSLQCVGIGLLGGVVVNAISPPAVLANPVVPAPFAPPADVATKEVAEANYNQSYQNYSQLLDQVTSINQFRDVSPTEWSFEALKNLVDNYGCIVGYPDRTYRGDRPLTR
ncbi:MAG: S-layer homology domain-containing protein, partial [Synechocystis sp.]|nr:S-layer homology domain-containing protein [Synechocystis sp.]